MFKYTIRVNESDFLNAANAEAKRIVSKSITYAIKKTRDLFIIEIKKALKEDKTYDDLIAYDDTLFFDIGSPNISSARDSIVEYVSNAINLRKNPPRKNDLGGLSLVILKQGIEPLLSMPYASYRSKGGQVDWLEWILTAGTSEVISNYQIMYGDFGKWSRTGEAIMIPSKTKGFSIEPEHAGTINDNWITRSLKRVEKKVFSIFEVILNQYIAT